MEGAGSRGSTAQKSRARRELESQSAKRELPLMVLVPGPEEREWFGKARGPARSTAAGMWAQNVKRVRQLVMMHRQLRILTVAGGRHCRRQGIPAG